MKKRYLILFLAFIIITNSSISAYAQNSVSEEQDSTVSIKYVSINTITSYLDINSLGKAGFSSYLSARDYDSLEIHLYLQKYKDGNWKTVKSWSKIGTSSTLLLSESYYVSEGNYRVVSYGYVYKDGELYEDTSVTSKIVSY